MDDDYYWFLRCKGLGPEDASPSLQRSWEKSKRRGLFHGIYDRKRRRLFSPGRFHATSQAGYGLNRDFVRGSAAWNIANGVENKVG